METDLQNVVVEPGTIWRVERSEDTETIRDPAGNIRYQGRHSMTATHFAMALQHNDELRRLIDKVHNRLVDVLPADDPLWAAMRQALFGTPIEKMQRLPITKDKQ